jgi:hypothetical protein
MPSNTTAAYTKIQPTAVMLLSFGLDNLIVLQTKTFLISRTLIKPPKRVNYFNFLKCKLNAKNPKASVIPTEAKLVIV